MLLGLYMTHLAKGFTFNHTRITNPVKPCPHSLLWNLSSSINFDVSQPSLNISGL